MEDTRLMPSSPSRSVAPPEASRSRLPQPRDAKPSRAPVTALEPHWQEAIESATD